MFLENGVTQFFSHGLVKASSNLECKWNTKSAQTAWRHFEPDCRIENASNKNYSITSTRWKASWKTNILNNL